MENCQKYKDSNGDYYYKFNLDSGNEFTVEKELGDYIHSLKMNLKGYSGIGSDNCLKEFTEFTEKLLTSKEDTTKFLVNAGILDKSGELTDNYK